MKAAAQRRHERQVLLLIGAVVILGLVLALGRSALYKGQLAGNARQCQLIENELMTLSPQTQSFRTDFLVQRGKQIGCGDLSFVAGSLRADPTYQLAGGLTDTGLRTCLQIQTEIRSLNVRTQPVRVSQLTQRGDALGCWAGSSGAAVPVGSPLPLVQPVTLQDLVVTQGEFNAFLTRLPRMWRSDDYSAEEKARLDGAFFQAQSWIENRDPSDVTSLLRFIEQNFAPRHDAQEADAS